jgi:FkbM family methyltransferase
MPSNSPNPVQTPDGRFLLSSIQKRADGAARFSMSLPSTYATDPGLSLLARLESEHAGFEFATRAFFDRHLAPGDIFLDIGAHFGLFSLAAATLHPRGAVKVVAFEAHPLNALEMLRQMGMNELQNEIDLVCCAAGSAPGFGKLWPFSTMGNFLSVDRPDEAFADNPALNVPIMPLDLYIGQRPELSTGRILAKIDVEGFEPDVMAGMDTLLASQRIQALTFEKSDIYTDPKRWRDFEAMIARLEGHGYRIFWFPHLHLPCALIPWVPGNEAGNLVALAEGFDADPIYDGPYAPYASPPPLMREDFSNADQADLTRRLIERRASDGWRWASPRNFENGAETRAALAAPHIPAKSRILDLGAGLMKMALRLRGGSVYTPLDLIRYASATIVADLNQDGFPDGEWDCALALELLEHIHDVPALLANIHASCSLLICTYECVNNGDDTSEVQKRRERGFFNDYDQEDLHQMLQSAGWRVRLSETHGSLNFFVCDGEDKTST